MSELAVISYSLFIATFGIVVIFFSFEDDAHNYKELMNLFDQKLRSIGIKAGSHFISQ